MPMNAGSVNAQGEGTGLAKEAFDIHRTKLPAEIGPEALAGIADLFNSLAEALVTHITANAVSHTTVSAGGLQRYDKAGTPTNTDAPSSPVELSGTIT